MNSEWTQQDNEDCARLRDGLSNGVDPIGIEQLCDQILVNDGDVMDLVSQIKTKAQGLHQITLDMFLRHNG